MNVVFTDANGAPAGVRVVPGVYATASAVIVVDVRLSVAVALTVYGTHPFPPVGVNVIAGDVVSKMTGSCPEFAVTMPSSVCTK